MNRTCDSACIAPLPSGVISQLRSGCQVSSFPQAVEEIVANSIDARSTRIAVTIDPDECSFSVDDDGLGVKPESLTLLGMRGCTSKVTGMDVVRYPPKTLGFKGEALAAISEVSVLQITSRARGSFETLTKIIRGGKSLKCGVAVEPRTNCGTTVCVRNFLFNRPVRQKQALKTRSQRRKDLEQIRKRLFGLLLPYPNIELAAYVSGQPGPFLHLPKNRSKASMMQHMLPEHHQSLVSFADRSGGYSITGDITVPPCGSVSKGQQFLFVNNRPVVSDQLFGLMTDMHSSACKYLQKSNIDDTNPNSRTVNTSPGFLIHVTMPLGCYDINSEPDKHLVVFKEPSKLLGIVRGAVVNVWGEKNPNLLGGLHSMDLPGSGRCATGSYVETGKVKRSGKKSGGWKGGVIGNEWGKKRSTQHPTLMPSLASRRRSLAFLGADLECMSDTPNQQMNDHNAANHWQVELSNVEMTNASGSVTCVRRITEWDESPRELTDDLNTVEMANSPGISEKQLIPTNEPYNAEGEWWMDFESDIELDPGLSGPADLTDVDDHIWDSSIHDHQSKHQEHVNASFFDVSSPMHQEQYCVSSMQEECTPTRNMVRGGGLFLDPNFDLLNWTDQEASVDDSLPMYPDFKPEQREWSFYKDLEVAGSSTKPLKREVEIQPGIFDFSDDNAVDEGMPELDFDSGELETGDLPLLNSVEGDVNFSGNAVKCSPIDSNTERCPGECSNSIFRPGLSSQFDCLEPPTFPCAVSGGIVSPTQPWIKAKAKGKRDIMNHLGDEHMSTPLKSVIGQPRKAFSAPPHPKKRQRGCHSNPQASLRTYRQFSSSKLTGTGSKRGTFRGVEAFLGEYQLARKGRKLFADVKEDPESNAQEQQQQNRSAVRNTTGLAQSTSNTGGGVTAGQTWKRSSGSVRKRVRFLDKAGHVLDTASSLSKTQSICQDDQQHPQTKIRAGTDVAALLNAFKNPCIAPPPPSLMEIADMRCFAPLHHIVPGSISRDVFQSAQILSQVDRKFIVMVAKNIVVAVDQHAADERVRLEQFQADVPAPGKESGLVETQRLNAPQVVDLTHMEQQVLEAYRDKVERWGWLGRWESDSGHFVLTHQPSVLGSPMNATELKIFLHHLEDTNGLDMLPPCVLRILKSKACRTAIMFGDELGRNDCCDLISKLKNTRLCFNCAHGRPTMAPLVNLQAFRKALNLNMNNDEGGDSRGLVERDISLSLLRKRLSEYRKLDC